MAVFFSVATQKVGSAAYLCIVDPDAGVPSTSERIIEDCARVWASIRVIIENKGAFVPHLANWAGHRKVPGNTGKNQWGGGREKRVAKYFSLGGEDR